MNQLVEELVDKVPAPSVRDAEVVPKRHRIHHVQVITWRSEAAKDVEPSLIKARPNIGSREVARQRDPTAFAFTAIEVARDRGVRSHLAVSLPASEVSGILGRMPGCRPQRTGDTSLPLPAHLRAARAPVCA